MITLISVFLLQGGDPTGVVVCCAIPVIVVVIFIVVSIQNANKLQKQLLEAKENYFNSLKKLKVNPTSADLKQHTLRLGRVYSELTRQAQSGNKSITIYDEVALMNDINAACAAAGAVSFITQPVKTQSVEGRLKQLADLKERGLMSEEEYQKKRQKIIDEI